MNKIILVLISTFSLSALAGVHGDDQRQYVKDVASSSIQSLAQSVAAMVPRTQDLGRFSIVRQENLVQKKNFCADEKYAQDPSFSKCSGVLIAPNKLLTTYHCVPNLADCQATQWIFNAQNVKVEGDAAIFDRNHVYSCKSIVASNRNLITLQDYTIIELDRPVTQAQPVKISHTPINKTETSLFMLGHPYGLELTLSQGRVLSTQDPHFMSTDLDAFSGNSGSPVFNARTFELEGIFIRGGSDDYTDIDTEDFCRRWTHCEVNTVDSGKKCESEDVTRIQSIPVDAH